MVSVPDTFLAVMEASEAHTLTVPIAARPGARLIRATLVDVAGAPITGGMISDARGEPCVTIPRQFVVPGARLALLWEWTEYVEELQPLPRVVDPVQADRVAEAVGRLRGHPIDGRSFRFEGGEEEAGPARLPVGPGDPGQPHYPLTPDEERVLADAEWEAQRQRIAALVRP